MVSDFYCARFYTVKKSETNSDCRNILRACPNIHSFKDDLKICLYIMSPRMMKGNPHEEEME